MRQAGHQTAIYSPRLGSLVAEARSSGVEVTDDLFSLSQTPDIIHGHHHQPLMQALLRFPMTPAIYICHDATSLEDTPCAFPRIRKYLAVDERCQTRVEQTLGETAGKVDIIPNAVDTERFQPRGPLPLRPRRALVFSNYAHAATQLPAVRKACRKARIQLDVMGTGMKTESDHPETVLPEYDLVFAKARCALEAMAIGNAVILCDFAGVGPYVTAADFEVMRRKNFGRALLTQPLHASALLRQINRYDAADAAALSERVRATSSLKKAVAQWQSIYIEVLNRFDAEHIDRTEESRATLLYLSSWHYLNQNEWRAQLAVRLQHIPIVGEYIYKLARFWWTRLRSINERR
jgi:hypothetical protein